MDICLEFGLFKVIIFKKLVCDVGVDLIMSGILGLNVVECFIVGFVLEVIVWYVFCDVLVVCIEEMFEDF